MEEFICEICKKKLEKKYEGAEPNTCAECVPQVLPENLAKIERKYELWNS